MSFRQYRYLKHLDNELRESGMLLRVEDYLGKHWGRKSHREKITIKEAQDVITTILNEIEEFKK